MREREERKRGEKEGIKKREEVEKRMEMVDAIEPRKRREANALLDLKFKQKG